LISYLALSGTTHGVAIARMNGTLVPIANSLQSSAQSAIQGRREAARVKNRAIDMLATNVLHLGPTYSRTERKIEPVGTINLVLIDSQSVGKRTHDLMDTVNVKKRWKTIYWRVNKYLN
jgi:hypothetical protein